MLEPKNSKQAAYEALDFLMGYKFQNDGFCDKNDDPISSAIQEELTNAYA